MTRHIRFNLVHVRRNDAVCRERRFRKCSKVNCLEMLCSHKLGIKLEASLIICQTKSAKV